MTNGAPRLGGLSLAAERIKDLGHAKGGFLAAGLDGVVFLDRLLRALLIEIRPLLFRPGHLRKASDLNLPDSWRDRAAQTRRAVHLRPVLCLRGFHGRMVVSVCRRLFLVRWIVKKNRQFNAPMPGLREVWIASVPGIQRGCCVVRWEQHERAKKVQQIGSGTRVLHR